MGPQLRRWFSCTLMIGSVALTACGGGDGAGGTITPPVVVTVASVTVSPDSTVLVPNATVTLVATLRDAAGNVVNRPVTWSSNSSVASVSTSGVVTAVTAGAAVISATSDGRSGTARITVRDGAIVGAVGGTVSALGGAVTVTIPAGALAASTVVTVERAANAPQDSRLVGATATEIAASSAIASPVRLRFVYDPARVPTGPPEKLLALYRATAGTWQLVPGSQIDLTAKTISVDVSTLGTFGVLAAPTVASVSLSLTNATLSPGGSTQLVATAKDAGGTALTGRDVTWASASPSIVSVSQTGVIAAVSLGGPVAITATIEGKSASAMVSVAAPSISLSAASLTFGAEQAAVLPAAQTITISSGTGGTLTGLSLGSVTYSPSFPSGWLSSPSLPSTVANPSVTLSIRPNTTSISPGTYTATFQVRSSVATNSPQTVTVTYTVTPSPACDPSKAPTITLGLPVSGTISSTDCPLPSSSYRSDLWRLTIGAPSDVRIDLTSAAFRTEVTLVDLATGSVMDVDASGPGNDSHINARLKVGTYIIRAGNYLSSGAGAYQLAVKSIVLGPHHGRWEASGGGAVVIVDDNQITSISISRSLNTTLGLCIVSLSINPQSVILSPNSFSFVWSTYSSTVTGSFLTATNGTLSTSSMSFNQQSCINRFNTVVSGTAPGISFPLTKQ